MENVIAFPALGWSVTVNRVALTVLGKDIYWYGVIIAAGFLLAALYCSRRIEQFGFTRDMLFDALLVALPSAIVCARLYYVVWEWGYYSQHPGEIIAIWKGGLAIYGGVIGALLAVSVYAKAKRLSIPGTFDVAALGLLIGQSIGRWGNFINGEAHGTITDTVLGMTVNGEGPFHPTFLYESVWNIVGFVVLHILSKRCYRFRGQIFLSYLIWYGAGRAWIEGLRTDSLYVGSTDIRISQVVAVVSCLVGAVLLVLSLRRGVDTLTQLINPHADARAVRIETKKETQNP